MDCNGFRHPMRRRYILYILFRNLQNTIYNIRNLQYTETSSPYSATLVTSDMLDMPELHACHLWRSWDCGGGKVRIVWISSANRGELEVLLPKEPPLVQTQPNEFTSLTRPILYCFVQPHDHICS